ncbi:MAG: VanR-ABDEGLN family response regulator transcription factor [Peptococcaceae bacterium]|nr:VanR-ABDEGLN family response regulator transcription factor [Peptococcaceae bacterium]
MADKILVVDDEKEIVDLVSLYLKNEGYEVTALYSGSDALKSIQNESFDLAILDIMMPEIDGLILCRKIREHHQYPIIMLTAKGETMDKVTGLTLGADDYMTKPFLPLELVARVKAQLRRYKTYNQTQSQPNEEIIVYGGLLLNISTHECFLNEKPLSLTPTEFAILRILCQHKGSVVSAENLFHEIWGEEYYDKKNNTISVHIRHLREKLGDSFENPKYIKTVWGCGYKIEQ